MNPLSLLHRAAARFDTAALAPPQARPPVALPAGRPAAVGWSGAGGIPLLLARHASTCEALRSWCGGPAPFSQATLLGADDEAAAEAGRVLALLMDGSLRLQALSRWQGLAWRLQLKLAELQDRSLSTDGDPWDAGWALATEPGRRRLAEAFRPRRPTLVLARLSAHGLLAPVAAQLAQRLHRTGAEPAPFSPPGIGGPVLTPPVRWLWLAGDERCARHGQALLLERG